MNISTEECVDHLHWKCVRGSYLLLAIATTSTLHTHSHNIAKVFTALKSYFIQIDILENTERCGGVHRNHVVH